MASIQINAVTNAAVYLLPAGIPAAGAVGPGASGLGSLLGRAAECYMPHPKHKMTEYKGLGMVGATELWAGVDTLEASIKWSSFDPVVFATIANPFVNVALQIFASIEQYTAQGRSAELPLIGIIGGMFHDAGTSPFKQHEQVETPSKMTVYHLELYIAGVQIYLYDAFSNVYMINGVDQLATYRANMGG